MNSPEQLFTQLLGLGDQWVVSEALYLEGNPGEVTLKIEESPQLVSQMHGSCCAEASVSCYDHVKKRTWRHLNVFQHVCYIECSLPRMKCRGCGSVTRVQAPWEGKIKGFTLLFEAFALLLIREMPVKAAAGILGVYDTQLWRMLHQYVAEAYEQLDFSEVTTLGCDELSARKGHKYLTVFADMQAKRVLFATEGKGSATWDTFMRELERHNGHAGQITDISIDMSKAYHSAAKRCCPKADIVFDRFHVIKQVNKAVDEVRKREHRLLSRQGKSPLKRKRWLWLKNPERLSNRHLNELEALKQCNYHVSKAYQMKMTLRDIYAITCPKLFSKKLMAWCRWVTWYYRNNDYVFAPMKQAAEMVQRHFEGIVGYCKSRLTNAFMEGLMSTFSAVKRKARGYRSNKYLTTVLYFVAAKLELPTLALFHRF